MSLPWTRLRRAQIAAVVVSLSAVGLLNGCVSTSLEGQCNTTDVTIQTQTTIAVGQTVQAAADYAISNCPASTAVVWSSDNTSIVTVASDGRMTGVKAGGPVTIRAKVNNKTGTAAITVTP